MLEILFSAIAYLGSPDVLLAIIGGTFFGIIVGAIPGLGSLLGITVVLPFTFVLDQQSSIALLLGTYCGSVYGGCIPAILINTPGTPQSAATLLDGYPMARNGYPARAIGYATVGSVIGGLFSCAVLVLVAPSLAAFGLRFGPIEFFALGVFALTCIAAVSRESQIKGILAALLGMFLATIGLDPMSGISRYDFDLFELASGFGLIPVLVGMFALSEVFWRLSDKNTGTVTTKAQVGFELPKLRDLAKRYKVILKSAFIGTWIGSLPGIGATTASLISYAEAKRTSPNKEKFGTGEADGVLASETANNAVTAGALVPTLAFGVPGDPVTAVMLGALTIQNIYPGPQLFIEHRELMTFLFVALFVVNILMLLMGATLSPLFSRVLKIPEPILLSGVVVLVVIGTYSINTSGFDLLVLLMFGLLGLCLRYFMFPLAPVVIGFVLSPLIESSFRRGMIIANGDFMVFFEKPIALILFILTLIFLCWPVMRFYFNEKVNKNMGKL